MSAMARFHRLLLRLYPQSFRDRFGADMTTAFLETLESRPTALARATFAVRAIVDAFSSAAAVRADERRASLTQHRYVPAFGASLQALRWDARTALRALRHKPGFVIAVVVTLALGIGANTAVFSLIDAVLLHPIHVDRPEQLVAVHLARSESLPYEPLQYPLFRTVEARSRGPARVAGFKQMSVGVRHDGRSEQLESALVSGDYFGMLGVRAQLGRLIQPDDDMTIGSHFVVVLSDALWTRWFDRSPRALGSVIHAGANVYTVVGIAPREFQGTRLSDRPLLWFPITMATSVGDGGLFSPRKANDVYTTNAFGWVDVIARVNDPRVAASVESDLNRVMRDYARDGQLTVGERSTLRSISLMPLTRAATLRGREDVVRFVSILLGVVAFTLLVACVNVANLLLARSAERRKEFSLRAALGASRGRLVRQLLFESVMLATLGAAAGIGVGLATMRVLSTFTLPGQIPLDAVGLGLDMRVLAFTSAAAIASAIIFGLVPAVTSSREEPIGVLRVHGRAGTRGPRNIFLAIQVALSLVLLVAASLFARSLQAGLRSDLGFDPRPLALVSVDVMRHGYTRQRADAYYAAAIARARAIPGVSAVAVANHVPLGPFARLPFSLVGAPPESAVDAGLNSITPDYFDVVGTSLIEGRVFTAGDDRSVPNVAIVNESAARLLMPGQSIVGRELRLMASIPVHVVGVVRETKYESVRDAGVPMVFMPITQQPALTPAKIVVRSVAPHQSLVELRRQIAALDPDVPVLDARLVTDQLDVALMPQRFGATLLGLFAFIALGVTAVGVYGVASYGVNRRLGEIGIRIALGARRSDIVRTVLGRSGNAMIVGVIAGSVGAAFASRGLQRFLFAVAPRDPLSFVGAVVITAAAAVLACWLPARRAMAVDPMTVIRD